MTDIGVTLWASIADEAVSDILGVPITASAGMWPQDAGAGKSGRPAAFGGKAGAGKTGRCTGSRAGDWTVAFGDKYPTTLCNASGVVGLLINKLEGSYERGLE